MKLAKQNYFAKGKGRVLVHITENAPIVLEDIDHVYNEGIPRKQMFGLRAKDALCGYTYKDKDGNIKPTSDLDPLTIVNMLNAGSLDASTLSTD